jgi:hypothetical protein
MAPVGVVTRSKNKFLFLELPPNEVGSFDVQAVNIRMTGPACGI